MLTSSSGTNYVPDEHEDFDPASLVDLLDKLIELLC